VLLGTSPILGPGRAAPPVAEAGQGDFAGLVDIGGGRHMYLECRGQGSPTVVLLSGYGNHGGIWSLQLPEVPQPQVLPGVAAFTRVCAYDRPGTTGADLADRSRSDPVPQPHAPEDVVADLQALLHAAAVPGPYVLAAHSLGGMYARLYAAAYPDEVAGMVLVDARQEHFQAEFTRVLPPALLAEAERLTLEVRDVYPDFELVDGARIDALVRQARVERPLRPLPLAVLSRGRADDVPVPDFPVEAWERAWRVMQDDLVTLVPAARQTIARQSGHYIQVDQPALVTEAIRQVVAGVRDPDTWYDLIRCCTN